MAVVLSGVTHVDALLIGGFWTENTGRGASVKFLVEPDSTTGLPDSDLQKTILSVLGQFSSVANIHFDKEVRSTLNPTIQDSKYLKNGVGTSDPTGAVANPNYVPLTINDFSDLGSSTLGVARFFDSGVGGATSVKLTDVDFTLDDQYVGQNIGPGTQAYFVALHELGHAVGLNHPSASNTFSSAILAGIDDSMDATVMVSDAGKTGASQGGFTDFSTRIPQTPMIYDIAALQYIYGANHSFNAGNNTYTINGSAVVKTLWDGGGVDTIVTGGFTGSTILDLREGVAFRTQVGASHVWNAFGANIENANGGTGNDTIFGNNLNNTLMGMRGNDSIDAGAGVDSVRGGKDADTINGGDGNDVLFGDREADIVLGGGGDDTAVRGGKGDDQIFGGSGNDIIYGDKDNDRLVGGIGLDTFVFRSGDGLDTVEDFTTGDKLQISSALASSAAQVLAVTTFVSGSAIINFGSDQISLIGVTVLAESDIVIF